MKRTYLALRSSALGLVAAAVLGGPLAAGVTDKDLREAGQKTDSVITYGIDLRNQRFSPLDKINRDNIKDMVPVWSFSFGGEKQRGQESQAIVYDGMIYVTGSYSRVLRHRCGHRRRDLGVRRAPSRRDHAVLRRHQPRGRDLRRQGLLRHPRRQGRGAGPQDRQGRLEQEGRRLQGGLHDHRGPDHRRRQGHHRQRRRRVRRGRPGAGAGRRDRQHRLGTADGRRPCRHPQRQAVDHDRQAQRELGGRSVEDRRRGAVERHHLRSGCKADLCRLGQRLAVELVDAPRRQPLHRVEAGAEPGHRRHRLGLSEHAPRRLGLRRYQRVHPVRHADGRQDHQGRGIGGEERLLLRSRPDQRQGRQGVPLRPQHHLGERASTRRPASRLWCPRTGRRRRRN